MALRAAPHTVTIYRRSTTGSSAYSEELVSWAAVAAGVAMDIQPPGPGEVKQFEYGRFSDATYKAFAAANVDIRPDDGVKITASDITSWSGRRFMVKVGGDWGSRGEVQVRLVDTHEDFDA